MAARLEADLHTFDQNIRPLHGIRTAANRVALIEQFLESIHRVEFVRVMRDRQLSVRRTDPNDELFDPLKAAIVYQRQGNVEEAFWMVFLFVHFGKNSRGGWRYAREVYGRLGDRRRWDWTTVSQNPSGFRKWLQSHVKDLKRQGVPGGFGNHRKYETLIGTSATVESYVAWVNPPRTHQLLIEEVIQQTDGDKRRAFDALYQSMQAVMRFGRTARFDYLTMLGKLGLAPIEPGSTYIKGSTGPRKGATLLFGRQADAAELDSWLVELDTHVNVGMQVLEDALCNWQKSPSKFVPFRG